MEIYILTYIVLVLISYGMTIKSGDFSHGQAFLVSVFFMWIAVPFLCIITFGKWIYSLNQDL